MKPTPFDPRTDLAPLPFDERNRRLAQELKEAGLRWRPHVGCFVWDPGGHIRSGSPFPGRVYFILNLGRFIRIFGSVEELVGKLVWLPTWHQARLLCRRLGVAESDIAAASREKLGVEPGEDLLALYGVLRQTLSGDR